MRAEHERGPAGRFAASLSRIAIIMNGSPLFTGDAGSGESEIRRFILEHDLLEALIALPEQLFYNTGIATYVWVVTTRKAPARREIPLDRATDIRKILASSTPTSDGRGCAIRWTSGWATPWATPRVDISPPSGE